MHRCYILCCNPLGLQANFLIFLNFIPSNFPIMTKITLVLFFILCTACTKLFNDKQTSANDNPTGVLYINTIGQITKTDATNDSTYWITGLINITNSAYNPLVFDTNFYYHGNHLGITCYSLQTGLPAWTYNWPAFDNAIPFREPAFKDSLVFFTAPTSVWDYAYLHCLKKKNGSLVWKLKIDSGNVYNNFNSTPVVYNDKVIVVTRNPNDKLYLNAFAISNGIKLWSMPLKNSVHSKMILQNGKVYSGYGSTITCHDANTGSQIWETDLPLSTCWRTFCFMDQEKMIIEKIISNTDYKIFNVNISTGSIAQITDLKLNSSYAGNSQYIAPYGSAFRNNQLFIGHYLNADSIDMYAFEIPSLSQKWKQRFAHNIYGGQMPLATDKYLVFPVNDSYNNPPYNLSKMIFLDFKGTLIKKLSFISRETDVFVYKEAGIVYRQTPGF